MADIARFLWLLEVLEIDPDDRILEIGCGAGLAAEQIAARLKGGNITAVDRSQPMIRKAIIRNEKYIRTKTAEFVNTDLVRLPYGTGQYNKIFAFNVNLFWVKGSIVEEGARIRSHLAKKGHLYLFYQPPAESGLKLLAQHVEDNLRRHGFELTDTVHEPMVRAFCMVCRPV